MTPPPTATAAATDTSAINADATNVAARDVDRSAVDTGCGCTSRSAPASVPRRTTATRAGLIGLLCILGCAAGPLAIGGIAAVTGAVAGGLRIIVTGFVAAATLFYHRRRTGRHGC